MLRTVPSTDPKEMLGSSKPTMKDKRLPLLNKRNLNQVPKISSSNKINEAILRNILSKIALQLVSSQPKALPKLYHLSYQHKH